MKKNDWKRRRKIKKQENARKEKETMTNPKKDRTGSRKSWEGRNGISPTQTQTREQRTQPNTTQHEALGQAPARSTHFTLVCFFTRRNRSVNSCPGGEKVSAPNALWSRISQRSIPRGLAAVRGFSLHYSYLLPLPLRPSASPCLLQPRGWIAVTATS